MKRYSLILVLRLLAEKPFRPNNIDKYILYLLIFILSQKNQVSTNIQNSENWKIMSMISCIFYMVHGNISVHARVCVNIERIYNHERHATF